MTTISFCGPPWDNYIYTCESFTFTYTHLIPEKVVAWGGDRLKWFFCILSCGMAGANLYLLSLRTFDMINMGRHADSACTSIWFQGFSIKSQKRILRARRCRYAGAPLSVSDATKTSKIWWFLKIQIFLGNKIALKRLSNIFWRIKGILVYGYFRIMTVVRIWKSFFG